MALAVLEKCLRAARRAAAKQGGAAGGVGGAAGKDQPLNLKGTVRPGRRYSSEGEAMREPDFRPSQSLVAPRRSYQVCTHARNLPYQVCVHAASGVYVHAASYHRRAPVRTPVRASLTRKAREEATCPPRDIEPVVHVEPSTCFACVHSATPFSPRYMQRRALLLTNQRPSPAPSPHLCLHPSAVASITRQQCCQPPQRHAAELPPGYRQGLVWRPHGALCLSLFGSHFARRPARE